MSFDRAEYTAYENSLERKYQAGVDQDEVQENKILAKKAELIGNAIADENAFIELQEELLYDDDLCSKLTEAMHMCFQGKGNGKLFEIIEQAARIKAEQLVKNKNTVDQVTGLFTQLSADAREHYDNNG